MKRLIMVGCLAVSLVAVLGISGNAQLTHRYSAKIPFDFSIRGKRLQAGNYTITTLSSVTNLRAVYLRDSSTGKGLVIGPAEVISSDSEERGALVFVRVDNGWVLQSVETATFALKLRKSPKANNSNMASDSYSSETKTVAIGN